ncbi:MAG TPA: TatD family hydrolase [Methylomirabilota bacterium]|nr:TatD family hydrolase [Methylomirabilota bacterium]
MHAFYDTHAHLDYPEFQPDFAEIRERARAAGIVKMISIGTDAESSKRAVRLAEEHSEIYAVVGWHPSSASEAPEDVRPFLHELAKHPKVVAIGETGLDYYRLPSTQGGTPDDDLREKSKQAEIFKQHLEVAAALGLNCVIHQRASLEDTLAQFSPFKGRTRGVFHCFTETPQVRQRVMESGCMVSFTGILTFKSAEAVRDSLKACAPGEFMFETDCPYLAPIPYRGKRCEPAYVKEIAEFAALVLNRSLSDLSRETCAAAENFFPKLKG